MQGFDLIIMKIFECTMSNNTSVDLNWILSDQSMKNYFFFLKTQVLELENGKFNKGGFYFFPNTMHIL